MTDGRGMMTDDKQQYEYAVMQERIPGLHRGPWPEEKAVAWVRECEEMGMRKGAFYVVRRPVGDWERHD